MLVNSDIAECPMGQESRITALTTRKPIEIRVTRCGKVWELCYVWGLLDTTIVPKRFPTAAAAKQSAYLFCGNAKPAVSVIIVS